MIYVTLNTQYIDGKQVVNTIYSVFSSIKKKIKKKDNEWEK